MLEVYLAFFVLPGIWIFFWGGKCRLNIYTIHDNETQNIQLVGDYTSCIGDYTTQLCGDYHKPLKGSLFHVSMRPLPKHSITRDSGSPKLRIVSWNLNTSRFGGFLYTPCSSSDVRRLDP